MVAGWEGREGERERSVNDCTQIKTLTQIVIIIQSLAQRETP